MTAIPAAGIGVAWEVGFTHQGLATATLWLAFLTTGTGLVLLWYRYGPTGGGLRPTVARWGHIVLGIALLLYVMGTYWIVPV